MSRRVAILATPLSNSIAGDLIVYLMCPLLVIGIASIITWAVRLNRRLSVQDQALGLLVQQVLPEGQPSLRDIVNKQAVEMAGVKGQLRTMRGKT